MMRKPAPTTSTHALVAPINRICRRTLLKESNRRESVNHE